MTKPKLFLLVCLVCLAGLLADSREAVAQTPLEQTLINLPANTWYAVPNTHMRDVCLPEGSAVDGFQGCGAIVEAWGGGAYDAVHRKMIIWGGGHETYYGNEVYAFDIPSARWERLNDPSPGPFNRDPLADGKPVSRHAFDGLQYITHANRFFGYGGAQAQNGGGTHVTWTFDVDTKTWRNMLPAGASPGVGHVYQLSSAYDAKTRNVYMRDPFNLYAYNFDTNTWTTRMYWEHVWDPQTAAIDSRRDLYFTIGAGEWLVYDITNNSDVTANWITNGGNALLAEGAPGLAYDANSDNLVAWHGGAVHVLNMQTRAWTRKSAVGAPPLPASNGTFGRWRYVSQYNVFILVNSVDDNVYFYKHMTLAPPPTPDPSGPQQVIEYYHAGLDHYFITWKADEIAKLDAGTVIKGWRRTDQTFKTSISAQVATSPVCRYYIPPGKGDSHFFGRGTAECDATGLQNPTFVPEEAAFMHMSLPAAGRCPAGTTPVYRVFSNRPDANHRYMIDRAIRDDMVNRGWLAEGDGPDLVVMCAP